MQEKNSTAGKKSKQPLGNALASLLFVIIAIV